MKPPIFHRIYGNEYNRALLPNPHLASLEEGVSTIAEARVKTGSSIGYPGWGMLYAILLCQLNPHKFNLVVETGSNFGCSSIVLGQALKDSGRLGKCHTIEIDEENYRRAQGNIRQAGVDGYVECHLGDSRQVLPTILAAHEEVQVAFLDGSHLYAHVLAEFELLWPKITNETLIILDNTYQIARRRRSACQRRAERNPTALRWQSHQFFLCLMVYPRPGALAKAAVRR